MPRTTATAPAPAPVQTTKPGTRVVSVRSVPGGKWGGYVAPAVYEAKARQDGTLTWRLVGRPLGRFWFQGKQMETGYRSVRKAESHAESIADEMGVAADFTVKHGKVCA